MTVTDVLAAAAEVEAFCRLRRWRFCFIGGIAVQRWGKPRFTDDVDLTLLTGLGSEEKFIEAILGRFPGRIDNAAGFALRNRVVLAGTAKGVAVDVALGAFPFEEATIRRATPWKVRGSPRLTTCTAEDLVILKVFAARSQDWADVENVLIRQRARLDLDYIRQELAPLLDLKESPEALEQLEHLVAKVKRQLSSSI